MKQDDKKIQIRNSTVDFLVFTKDAHEEGIEVRVQNGTVWLTQKAISELFDIDRSVVNKHLKNIYESGAAPEDVAEVIAELLSELQDISDDKALTAAGYFHTNQIERSEKMRNSLFRMF